MYLHKDKEVFEKAVRDTSVRYGLQTSIVEKDYYVTMLLKLLAQRADFCVFKGGTSLSKGFHLLRRFSEDIDIAFTEHLGEKRRKKLKYDVLKGISDELGMPIVNWEKIQSDRDYNCYIFSYEPMDSSISESLFQGIRLETALASYAFPTERRKIDSHVGRFLMETSPESVEKYGLEEFDMRLQSVERTYIDKIFAICDYFIQGKARRYSRHMYDIYILTQYISFDSSFQKLVEEVRNHRMTMKMCPSAGEGFDIPVLLREICASDFFKTDYEEVTSYFIQEKVAYEDIVIRLLKIAAGGFFDRNLKQ